MKLCKKCNKSKPLSEFGKRARTADGRQAWCRACANLYSAERYKTFEQAAFDRRRQQIKDRMEEKWALMRAHLKAHPCITCGETDPVVMEFNHRDPSLKSHNIGSMMRSHSWANIALEMEKCDVMCANCHRRHTANQLGWWRAL